jgi:hypothetical protein
MRGPQGKCHAMPCLRGRAIHATPLPDSRILAATARQCHSAAEPSSRKEQMMPTTTLTSPPGASNWWTSYRLTHTLLELGAFEGWLVQNGDVEATMDSSQLATACSAFTSFCNSSGAASILAPPLAPGLR